ncbi:MAG: N-acetylmuramoyl-L-alanine amidase [Candidatus Omnitrophica bacterium]|nr:N-acetylmuramoyl-L-alanine amidase [Candidatus Omnitrophota bacterium]
MGERRGPSKTRESAAARMTIRESGSGVPQWEGYTRQFNGTRYMPLFSKCERHQVSWDWDAASRRVVLEKGEDKMVLALGLEDALVNGALHSFKQPVVLDNGVIMIPESMATDAWWSTAPPPPVHVHRFDSVVIDAGHGGKDPGAQGPGGIREKDVVLDIAKRVRDILSRYGVHVLMSRSDDRFITLEGRARLANQNGTDFFVSIHANASKSKRASGFEVYYLSEAIDEHARATASSENKVFNVNGDEPDFLKQADATLWDLIHSENRRESMEMSGMIVNAMRAELPVQNRGVKTARFYVLRGAETPSVLVEVGFITNPKEAQLLSTQFYRQQVAQAVSQGILAYKRRFEETNGFTE